VDNETALARTDSASQTAVIVFEPKDLGGLNLPSILDAENAVMAYEANMEGVAMRFDRVKIPSGGASSFEVPDETGEAQPMKKLTGIILDHYPVNAYWANPYSGENNPPDCVAQDGKNGTATPESGLPGGPCARCEKNRWGTDVQKDGSAGKGKACKNLHRIYLLLDGTVIPYQIALPPTSLGNLQDYLRRLMGKLIPCYRVVTEVSLTKDKNAGGIEYSKAVFKKVADLSPQAGMAVKTQIIDKLRDAMRAEKIEAADYDTSTNSVSDTAATSATRTAARQGNTQTAPPSQEPFDN
jgi:hypothetical protein